MSHTASRYGAIFRGSPLGETSKPDKEGSMTPVRKIIVAGFSALALGAAALAPTAASAHGSGGFGVGLGIGLGLGLLRPPVYAPVPYPVYHGPGYHSCS